MRISYEGDKPLADALLPEARHAFVRTKAAQGARSGQWKVPLSKGHCIVTLGRGVEGIHIVAIVSEDEDIARVPRMYAGVTLDRAQLYTYKRKDGSMLLTLDAYNMTEATKEEYNYKAPLVLSAELPVVGHVSMPTRMDNIGADTQYTVQLASLYTGKMSKLVQVIQSYGIPKREEELSRAMTAIAQANPSVLFDLRGSLFSKDNLKGVQNQFNWEYQRTHGIFEHTFTDDEGNEVAENWLIEIATDYGVRAMPLQLEPVTTTPYFKAYIASQIAKDGHKKFYEDIQLVLDTFGGYPTNEGFLTKHKDKIVTLIPPGQMERYEKGQGASTDIGWAFNDKGTMANNVCLEERGEGANLWFMAHHCQISIGYDREKRVPTAQYAVLESGSTPIGHGKFKVYDTALDRCVSYNMQHLLHGTFAGRPKATGTAMHVFYKNDKLIVLRYQDSNSGTPSGPQTTGTTAAQNPYVYDYTVETWTGATGMAGGFFCEAYDGRLPTFGTRTKRRRSMEIGGERGRGISVNPANDTPEYFWRTFAQRYKDLNRREEGSTTWNNCAFLPLGDRSAFYIVNMVEEPWWTESLNIDLLTANDPYKYVLRDTYIWNFDLGTMCGTKYPFKYAGVTLDGIVNVVWDREGSRGRTQLDHYCQAYVIAPFGYKGGGVYGWSQSLQDQLDQWSSATGQAEWYSIGAEPIEKTFPYNLSGAGEYSKSFGGRTRLEVFFYSLGKVGLVFERFGSYLSIYHDYWYWFDPSPNSDGDFQTMWARRNCFGPATYQLWSTDVNDSRLATDGTYPLTNTNFPTFIGVVGPLAT